MTALIHNCYALGSLRAYPASVAPH